MGKISEVENEVLKPIAEMYKREFKVFQENEEVVKMMSFWEEKLATATAIATLEAKEEAREEERNQTKQIISELKKGKSPQEVADMLKAPFDLVIEWKDMLEI